MNSIVTIWIIYFVLMSIVADIFSIDNIFHSEIKLKEHKGELCSRKCNGVESRICYFKFNIEFYQAMGVACKKCTNGNATDCNHPQCVVGDGIQKGVMTINRQVPGPAIQVCLGDTIVVDVMNKAPGTDTSIHWHGLNMRDAKFMDGVPFITQCPIPCGTRFRYQFEAKQVGTHFYHSHSGFQKTNGIYGALIIRQPLEENPLAEVYDYDLPQHILVISDWLHHYAEFFYPGIQGRLNKPDAVLLNGRGTFIHNVTRIRKTAPPPHIFYVKSGRKYRLRAIAANSFACPMQLQVESHVLIVIATDGFDVKPKHFDTLILNAGERYDFVLHANQAPGDYWIRLRGLGVCELHSITEAFILLRYKISCGEKPLPEFPDYDDTYPKTAVLNYPNQTCNNLGQNGCITSLKSIVEDADLLKAEPDIKFYIGFHNIPLKPAQVFNTGRFDQFRNLFDNHLDVAVMNNISFVEPSSPLLSQPSDVDESMFCDKDHLPKSCRHTRFCSCVHRLKVAKGSIVEMIFVDETDVPLPIHHPIHLHGYHFMVTDLGQCVNNDKMSRRLERKIPKGKCNKRPPIKDTVSVPTSGYAVVRFRADNTGYWFLHCHYDYHMIMGMALVLQVGEKWEMPTRPKGFPKCGDYLPKVFLEND